MTFGITHAHPLTREIGRRAYLPFYLVAGLDLVLFGDWLAGLLVPGQAEILRIAAGTFMRGLGIVLLLSAAETVLLTRATGGLRRFLPAIPILNACWVGLSIVAVALAHDALSGAGVGVVLLVALLAGALAAVQARSLRSDPIADQ